MKYDPWFDDSLPTAQYGSLQCWIYNDNVKPWVKDVDLTTIHNVMYSMAGINLAILGGGSSGVW